MLGFAQLGRLALGQSAPRSAFSIIAAAGSFVLAGQDANATIVGTSEVGAFTLAGQTANGNLSMPAAVGGFTLTGQAAGSVLTISMVAASTPAVRSRSWVTFAALGSTHLGSGGPSAPPTFALKGQSLSFGLSMPAAVGAFVLTGQQARLEQGVVLGVNVGAFTIAGQDANVSFSMPAAVGSFALTGQDVEFRIRVPKIRAFPRVGRNTVSARATGRDGIKLRAYGG